ncbi:MAG TPA: hypothetical protein VK789_14100 [Bryobacteraceae bacterium]|jgi:hypothetical protein|nr:hypothetical protein [Bryobacteraceae bacterium]
MKDKIFRIVRKAALPAMLAAALTIPVGAFAEGHGGGHYGGGGHYSGGHGFSGGHVEHGGGGYYRGGGGWGRHDWDDHGHWGGGWGGGVYFGGAPYYGYGYAAPAPGCGYYDQYGNWIATACAVPPYGY